MARKVDPKRDRAIAAALKAKHPAAEVAAKYGLTPSSVYRAAARGRARPEKFAAPAAATAPAQSERSAVTGDLFSALARTGIRRFGGTIYDDYDSVFRTLNKRIALFREMGDDPVAAAVMQACKMTLRRLGIHAETDGVTDADKQARDFLEQAWDDMSQSGTDTIDQASNMLAYGFYPAELVYKKRQGPRPDKPLDPQQLYSSAGQDAAPADVAGSRYNDGRIGWRKWVFMAPESLQPGNEWVFDQGGGVQGINQMAPPEYRPVTIPIQKIVLFRTTAEKGNPEGRSLYRAMYKAWYFKNNLEEIEAISAERMGAGFPVVYLGTDTTKRGEGGDDLDTFRTITSNIRVDEQMGLVIPYPKMGKGEPGEGVLFELVSPPSRGAVDFNQVITRHEQRMAMVGLAQFIHLGMNGVGARSLGESAQDFFTLAISAWADSILDTINRYPVERLFALNYFPGMTQVPRLAHEAVAQIDLKKIADYVNSLVGEQLITPSLELEQYLLSLADLPATPKLAELWDAKTKAADAARARLAALPVADAGALPAGGQPGSGGGTPPAAVSQTATTADGKTIKVSAANQPELNAERFEAAFHKGVMLALYPPAAVAAVLAIPSGMPAAALHLTLAYLGDAASYSAEQLAQLARVARGVALVRAPVTGTISGHTLFTTGDGAAMPLVALVDSADLPGLRQQLVMAMAINGFVVPADHGFTPHITLDYQREDHPISPPNAPPADPIRFDRLTLVIGDKRQSFLLTGAGGGPDHFGGSPDAGPKADSFAGAPGRPRKELAAVNAYQADLTDAYGDWADDAAGQLAAEPDDTQRQALLSALLLLLLSRLETLGETNLPAALALGTRGAAAPAKLYSKLAQIIDSNTKFLTDSLIPDLRAKIEQGLVRPEWVELRAPAEKRSWLMKWLDGFEARIGSYAGTYWTMYNWSVGMSVDDQRLTLDAFLDPQARHCSECPQYHREGGEHYDNFDQYLGATGGRVPGEFECGGGCRCRLEFGPPDEQISGVIGL